MLFIPGQVYRRGALHDEYGGQRQGGISTPKDHQIIFLFTGEGGEQYGYEDGWQADDLYYYTGEGQNGDMQLIRGNRAIDEHTASRKDIHLFQQAQPAHVRYVGQFVCSGYHVRLAAGSDGKDRQAITFELIPIEDFAHELQRPEVAEVDVSEISADALRTLRELALEDSSTGVEAVERRALSRRRSEAIRQYVLGRARGICEGCHLPAPFLTVAGTPYLEPHHIRRLSDGGPDHPGCVAAVCANCHRRAHYSGDAVEFNKLLSEFVENLEREL
jgi:5-methylcytosine-specific restriction protein A